MEDHNHPFHVDPIIEKAEIKDGSIIPESSIENIRDQVLKGNIIILKEAFPPDDLRSIRHSIHQWGLNVPESDVSEDEASATIHRVDDNPEETYFSRLYHFYYFKGILENGGDRTTIDNTVKPYFELLASLQAELGEYDLQLEHSTNGPNPHPQAIQYPSGGGYFSMHLHDFLPQKIGLILSISEKGVNFSRGGTRFATDGHFTDIEDHHSIGDIALFRYDLPHEVVVTDPKEKLDWESERGRWSLILPYY